MNPEWLSFAIGMVAGVRLVIALVGYVAPGLAPYRARGRALSPGPARRRFGQPRRPNLDLWVVVVVVTNLVTPPPTFRGAYLARSDTSHLGHPDRSAASAPLGSDASGTRERGKGKERT